ncbi:MAG TPA: hypothetical protein VK936_09485 [Longimicrobiales bacterium]|nr:hypothetical protein [Longimicrobiales bacterium]
MRGAAWLVAAVALGAAGCAAVTPDRQADPRAQLREGVAAIEAQEYLRARGLLEPLFYDRPREIVGQHALLLLVAAELDHRNPDRRLWAAADMAGRLLGLDGVDPWLVPLAETYYLLAMELGAAEQRIELAETAQEAAEQASERLPQTSRESVPAQIGRIAAERDQARRRAEQLEQQLTARDRELRETRQELERVKRTIRP